MKSVKKSAGPLSDTTGSDHDNDHDHDDGDDASSTTSNTDSNSLASSIDDVKLKLFQMKRANNKKQPQSKLLMKFKNFITPEQRAKNELNKRIETGIRSCLMYHNPVELSSICGVLGLKSLQRANVSIELILKYCKGADNPLGGGGSHGEDEEEGGYHEENNDYNENKVLKVVNSMWEGALYEYLKSIGHPILTAQDPKQTVMKIWRHGGFHSLDAHAFTPHYIQKRVITRYDKEQSEDITVRQLKLKELEKIIKYTERELFEEHNYTNALLFFQQLGEIRRLETEFRDYLIYQLELIRGDISRMKSNMKLSHEMVEEIEERYLKGVSELNEKLSITEAAYEDEMEQKFQLIEQIQVIHQNVNESISNVLVTHQNILKKSSQSPLTIHQEYCQYLSTPQSHLPSLPPSSSTSTSSLHPHHHQIQKYNLHLQNIYRKIHQNIGHQIQINENLTYQISSQQKTIVQHEQTIHRLRGKLQKKNSLIQSLKEEIRSKDLQMKRAARDINYMMVTHSGIREQAWKMGIRMTSRVNHLEEKLNSIKMIMKTGMQLSSNRILISFINGINNILDLVPKETMNELYEGGVMQEEDRRSELMRQDEIRMALVSGGNKVKKKKKVVKKGGGSKKSSTGGKKAAASSSGKKATTAAASSGTKKGASGGGKETKKGSGSVKKKK